MTLKNQLKDSLLKVSEKVKLAQEEINKTFTFINSFFINEYISSELNRLFAQKRVQLEKLQEVLKIYSVQYKTIANYTEIIQYKKEESIKKAIEILDKH